MRQVSQVYIEYLSPASHAAQRALQVLSTVRSGKTDGERDILTLQHSPAQQHVSREEIHNLTRSAKCRSVWGVQHDVPAIAIDASLIRVVGGNAVDHDLVGGNTYGNSRRATEFQRSGQLQNCIPKHREHREHLQHLNFCQLFSLAYVRGLPYSAATCSRNACASAAASASAAISSGSRLPSAHAFPWSPRIAA